MKFALEEERRRNELNRAQVAAYEAQRDYYERAQMPTLDAGEMYREVTKLIRQQTDE
jgi:hypothetical protein